MSSGRRSLLQGPSANKDVLTVASTRPLTDNEPASSKKAPTKTTVSSGNVECTLDSVPDAATNTAHNVLKCVKKTIPGNSLSSIIAITGQNPGNVNTSPAGTPGSAIQLKTPSSGIRRAAVPSSFKRPAAFKPASPAPYNTVASIHSGYDIHKDSPAPSPVVAPNVVSPQNSLSDVKASPAAGHVIIKDSPAPSHVNAPQQNTPSVVVKVSPAVVPPSNTQNDLPAASNSGVNASPANTPSSNSPNNLPQDSLDAEPSTDDLDNFPGDSPFAVPPPSGLNDIEPEDSPAVANSVEASPVVMPSPVIPKPSTAVVKVSPAVAPSPVTSQPSPSVVKASPAVVPSPVPRPCNNLNAVPVPTTAALNTHDTEVLHTAINRFGSRWELAPVCKTKPSRRTAVQDTMGRLWWFEDGVSCAHRNTQGTSMLYNGYVQVKWETAQACKATPTLINVMTDAQGRLWGWTGAGTADGDNCKFADAAGKAMKQEDILEQIIPLAAAESTQLN